jgi:D-alanyl-D-alanine carboxypeptidase
MKNKIVIRVSAIIVAIAVLFGFLISATMFSGVKLNAIPPSPPKASGATAGQTTASAMCTLDAETGRVFYEHNADAKLPMASTTKIVTAIAVIDDFAEKGRDLDEKHKIDDKAVGIEGTSIYLQKGESLSARELLLGLMLRSGNDSANALALMTRGTLGEFAELMNETARRAGAKNSNFKNAHGLDEEGHYTTARDLATISAYAMKNPTFAEIVKTKQATIDGVEYPRVLHNKNRLLKTLNGCVGVKTGFTKKAGRCFVGALETNGQTAICVVLNCGPMFEEAAELMRDANENFPKRQLVTADQFIEFADTEQSNAIAIEDFTYPLSNTEVEDKTQITLEGDEVVVKLADKEIYRADCNVI